MFLNQLLFFGLCLNPICLIAAMPHCLAITVAVGSWINKTKRWGLGTGQGESDQVRPSADDAAPALGDADYSEWQRVWRGKLDWSQWIQTARAAELVREIPPFHSGDIASYKRRPLSYFEQQLRGEIEASNQKINRERKRRYAQFFATVERNPLTDEQMDACICMEDAVQVVAAAGSGKSSTIIARVGYALSEQLVRPDQILILAFNRGVKKELESRIGDRLGEVCDVSGITIKTFNSFGLEVIGEATQRKPRLAEWAAPGQELETLSQIVKHLKVTDPNFANDWDLFRTIYGRELKPADGGKEHGKAILSNILTAGGSMVKSQEERMICDFLFFHGVEYEYEREYEYDTATDRYAQYLPDFYYPSIGVYHEHFALGADGNPPSDFGSQYLEGVKWKRSLHAEMGTVLFETTSHGLRNGPDLERLRGMLEEFGLELKFDPNRQTVGPAPIPTKQLVTLLCTFKQHVKSNGLTTNDLRRKISNQESGHRDRNERFVSLYERISVEWQRRLEAEKRVDFDDMLLDAIRHIESGAYTNRFKMILVDEFQDVSQAKLKLLKALKETAPHGASLFAVGDDWQGINRFAGADIAVMTGFSRKFPNATTLKLSQTFRCPQVISDAASAFVQKNPKQIKKRVRSANTYPRAIIHAFASRTTTGAMEKLENDLRMLATASRDDGLDLQRGVRASVMLLGRYNRDRPPNLPSLSQKYKGELDISFSTAHASKGLEADYVMMLNVTGGLAGFPSQIVDDPVLTLAMPEPDDFPFAEERRLFYVALTRARRQVRIYTIIEHPSCFVTEMAREGVISFQTEDGPAKVCPKCRDGLLAARNGSHGPYEKCSNAACSYTKKLMGEPIAEKWPTATRLQEPVKPGTPCPICNGGKMTLRAKNGETFLGCSNFPECRTTAKLG